MSKEEMRRGSAPAAPAHTTSTSRFPTTMPSHRRSLPPPPRPARGELTTGQQRGGESTSSLFRGRLPRGRRQLRPSERTTATRKPDWIWELDPNLRTSLSQQANSKLKLTTYCRGVTSAISGKPWPPARLGIYPAGKTLATVAGRVGRRERELYSP
jgi:hypothetical protein